MQAWIWWLRSPFWTSASASWLPELSSTLFLPSLPHKSHETVPLIMQVLELPRWLWSSSWTSTTVSSLPGPSSTWLPPSPPCQTCPGTPAVSGACQGVSKRDTGQVTALPDLPWNTCGKQSMSKSVKEYRRGIQDRSPPCQTCPGTPAVSRACQRVSKRDTGQVTALPDLPWYTCGKQSISKNIEEGYRTGRGFARPACGKQSMSKSIKEGYRKGHGPARPVLQHLR